MKHCKIPEKRILFVWLATFFLLINAADIYAGQVIDSKYRSDLIQMVINKWHDTSAKTGSIRWQKGIGIWLERLSTEQLESALTAASYEEIVTIINQAETGFFAANSFDQPQVAAGKLYYPLEPCRIVDTRIASGTYAGPIGSGSVLSFNAKETIPGIIGLQGGKIDGCGVPLIAQAVVVNITATQQPDPRSGHLRAFPWGITMPLAAILNFSGNTIGNSTVLPICSGTCNYDFSIYASRATHMVVDVMGYFAD